MSPSPIAKLDVTVRITTLLILFAATICAQIFIMPTYAAIFARDGMTFPAGARLAAVALDLLFNPVVALVLIAGIGFMLWKRWGDLQQRLAAVGIATLVFGLVLMGQASLLIAMALMRLTLK